PSPSCVYALSLHDALPISVLVMVSGYSRWLMARMLPSRAAGDLFAGMWTLLSVLGAVPKTLVWDNEGAIGQWKGGRPQLTGEAKDRKSTRLNSTHVKIAYA